MYKLASAFAATVLIGSIGTALADEKVGRLEAIDLKNGKIVVNASDFWLHDAKAEGLKVGDEVVVVYFEGDMHYAAGHNKVWSVTKANETTGRVDAIDLTNAKLVIGGTEYWLHGVKSEGLKVGDLVKVKFGPVHMHDAAKIHNVVTSITKN